MSLASAKAQAKDRLTQKTIALGCRLTVLLLVRGSLSLFVGQQEAIKLRIKENKNVSVLLLIIRFLFEIWIKDMKLQKLKCVRRLISHP